MEVEFHMLKSCSVNDRCSYWTLYVSGRLLQQSVSHSLFNYNQGEKFHRFIFSDFKFQAIHFSISKFISLIHKRLM